MTTSGSMTATEVFAALNGQLIAANAVSAVSSGFTRLASDRERVEFVYELLKRHGLLPGGEASAHCRKSDAECERVRQQAENARENGNKLMDVLQIFTKAVACGSPGSENLGKAYCGRSDVLFKLGFFANCKEDLQIASECVNANQEKIKFKLGECEAARVSQLKRVDDDVIPAITHAPNSAIACAGDSVTIKKSVECGRFVAATKNIQMGDVIAVENPYGVIVASDAATTHCHHCLRMSYGPMPCSHCTYAIYCSPECKSLAWKHHHQFECAIIGELQELDLPNLTLFALRVAILAASQYDLIETYSLENDTREERYESGRYQEIHNLCANTELRSVADLFNRAVTAALIYDQVKRKTTFFATGDSNKHHAVFKGLLLRHMQIAPSNFHEITEKVRSGEGEGEMSCIEIGGGAYSFLSMINHSCAPNVVRHSYGSTIVLRALSPIRMGEQLFDNYGYHYAVMPKDERRQHLKSQYLFVCQCQACEEDWPTYDKLEIVAGRPEVSYEDIEAVKSVDREGIKHILAVLLKKARALERLAPPTKNLADVQECIKECYSRLGNMRFT